MQKKSLKMTSVENDPMFNGKKREFSILAVKIKFYLAIMFFSASLSANFKDSLPVNDQVELDLSNPDKLAENKCKAMNLHAMNLLTVMTAEDDFMLIIVESVESKEWPNRLAYALWEKLLRKFKPSDQVAEAE